MTTNECLRVGMQAPDFSATAVVDQEFKDITLSQYRGKYVVLFFYPLDFTFVCPTEITAFSDRYSDFSNKNTEVLGVSVDSKFTHLAWIQTPRNEGGIGDINYPLVSDLKREICQSYNVLNDDGEEIIDMSEDDFSDDFDGEQRSFGLFCQTQPIFDITFDGSDSSIVNVSEESFNLGNHYFVTGEELTYRYLGAGTTSAIGISLSLIHI